ncbi:MAG: Tol-Pal system protein TolB [Holosporales bacterium]|jgi:TolB protein|nr:Tol-Pal system protein TolB [Holosporales bacterium]
MFFKILFIVLISLTPTVNALKIEISRGMFSPDPIAIQDFFGEWKGELSIGRELSKIISSDLELSGLFAPIDASKFLESQRDLSVRGPNLRNWRVINARFLVYGSVKIGIGSITVKFTLFDVVTEERMLLLEVKGAKSELRKIAHIIADYIYERITNEKGYFNTNIIYVETANDKESSKRTTRLVMVDQDGHNRICLTDDRELNLTPRYSRDGKMIAFVSYRDNAKNDALGKSAHVYIMYLDSRSRRLMLGEAMMKKLIKENHGNPVRMTYAPRFSPDGEWAVFAIIIDGKSAIYGINFVDNKLIQLTPHDCINTSPDFSSDGKYIVFTSNRDGKEKIYTMNRDGSNVRKISLGDGKYSQPVWSPRGDLIACSKQKGGRFSICLMKPDGSGERTIASEYLAEAPCWSSNGRYIAYTKQSGPKDKPGIEVIDITGQHTRGIPVPNDASYPAWSPTPILARQ